ncbi:MAG: hypothetical protein IJ761_01065 [Bacteroidales bacterium]|nr:hypothetical protein [Bacteroidales bacterium]
MKKVVISSFMAVALAFAMLSCNSKPAEESTDAGCAQQEQCEKKCDKPCDSTACCAKKDSACCKAGDTAAMQCCQKQCPKAEECQK